MQHEKMYLELFWVSQTLGLHNTRSWTHLHPSWTSSYDFDLICMWLLITRHNCSCITACFISRLLFISESVKNLSSLVSPSSMDDYLLLRRRRNTSHYFVKINACKHDRTFSWLKNVFTSCNAQLLIRKNNDPIHKWHTILLQFDKIITSSFILSSEKLQIEFVVVQIYNIWYEVVHLHLHRIRHHTFTKIEALDVKLAGKCMLRMLFNIILFKNNAHAFIIMDTLHIGVLAARMAFMHCMMHLWIQNSIAIKLLHSGRIMCFPLGQEARFLSVVYFRRRSETIPSAFDENIPCIPAPLARHKRKDLNANAYECSYQLGHNQFFYRGSY